MDMSGMSSSVMSSVASTSSGMNMPSSTIASAAAASNSAGMDKGGMDMGGMGMGGGSGDACKISMLWNWYTIDSCFLASSWHVRSSGMFAGSCIGVVLLVMVLEALRRAARDYDAYIAREYQRKCCPPAAETNSSDSGSDTKNGAGVRTTSSGGNGAAQCRSFTPNVFQQLIRAFLHMCQFAVAYIVMLLAMYFNGYIIICIFLGAFVGSFIFGWHSMALQGQQRELTFCCG